MAAGRDEIRRISLALKVAARQLEERLASADPITALRATAFRDEILRTLKSLEDTLATSGANLVPRTVSSILDLHKAKVPEIVRNARGAIPVGLTARLDQLNSRVLTVLAARRGGTARTFRTLIRRHMEDAAPALDGLLEAGIAQGMSVDRLAKVVGDFLQGSESAAISSRGLGGLTSIKSDAEMIARSETMNALREANAYALTEGGVVEAAKWQLSGNHSEEDECDILAEADGWGYGPGFYPVDRWPIAVHPRCGCYQGEVRLRPVDQWGTQQPPSPSGDLDPEDLADREGWSEAEKREVVRRIGVGLNVPSRAA